jgi:hypothetical protein
MEGELERDWAYLCQAFAGGKEVEPGEKQYTCLAAAPPDLLYVEGEAAQEVPGYREEMEDFAVIDYVRTGVAVEEVARQAGGRGGQAAGGVAEAEERVREALGIPSMVGRLHTSTVHCIAVHCTLRRSLPFG